MKKRVVSILSALALAAFCAPALAADAAVSLTDMAGREISLDEPVSRIIALNPADCEILYAIGAEALLAGRGEYCNYPEAVTEIPSVASGAETNLEQILALEPQVIVMSKMAQTQEQVEALEKAGIRVLISDAQDIEGVYTAIGMLGILTGRQEEADTLITEMREGFASVSAQAGEGRGTVYFEVSPLEWGLWTAGSGTFMDELAAICGLSNAFSDVAGWAEISQEQVIARDPDYIVTISGYDGQGPTPVEEMMARTGWESLKSVSGGRVYQADSDSMSRPGPRLLDAARDLMEFMNAGAAQEPAA